MKLRENNMANIRRRFTVKTGVPLPEPHRRRMPVRSLLLAAVLASLLTLTAFAGTLFSGLEGDELSLSANYLGGGIVEVTVENRSSKPLNLQPTVKLLRWRTSEELVPSGEILVENTSLAPGGSGVMTIDLSAAYDVAALEEPLEDDSYYFVLTNNRFAFGQDWMCFVSFSGPEESLLLSPVDPEWLRLEGPDDPEDQRWTCQWGNFTWDRKLIAEEDSHALVLFADVPSSRYPGSLETIPVRYVLSHNRPSVESQEGNVLICGQTVSLAELADCRVYEDEEYICCEVSRYIFDDLEQYVRDWAEENPNVRFSEEVLARIQAVYDSFPEEISIARRETPLTAASYIPRAQ